MGILKRNIIEIPVEEVKDIDKLAGKIMSINVDDIPAKFKKIFEESKNIAYKNFTMEALYESYEIDFMKNDTIRLKNGTTLRSKTMAEMFSKSKELSFMIATLYGYDDIEGSFDNMLMEMFLDSWGTAFIECGQTWTLMNIAKGLEDDQFYTTYAFSPGQGEIPMELQLPIFNTLKPGDIGVSINSQYMMHPKKSISGVIGLQTEKDEKAIRPCDICDKKETCPNAYA